MQTVEFAICVEHRPGELKPVVCGVIRTSQLPYLLMNVARLNDQLGVFRVVVNDHLINTLEITAGGFQVRGVPAFEA